MAGDSPTRTLTLRDIAKPEKLESLTLPQMGNLLSQLKTLVHEQGGAKLSIESNPADFAMKHSGPHLSGDLGGDWACPPHLGLISDAFAKIDQHTLDRVLIAMPPRHGKSVLSSFWGPIWYLARDPTRRVILISYEMDFARTWGEYVRDWIIDYGDPVGLRLHNTRPSASNWRTHMGGGMRTAGAGGPIVGKGADLIIIDDPIKNSEEAQSDVMREKMKNWFETTVMSRLEPGGSIVEVQTRWHEDDLQGYLEDKSINGTGDHYEVIKFPAIAVENDILGRKPGEVLWPERYPLEVMEARKKSTTSYNFSAVYQQTPTPEEGASIKRGWWQRWKVKPAAFDQMIQSWDLAFKDLQSSDYTVGQVWGRRGAEFFLLHQIRDHMNAPEVLSAIKNIRETYPEAKGIVIEDKANGPAVIAMLQQEVFGVIPMPAKASKDARLQAVAPMIESRNVWIPSIEIAKWSADYVEEFAAFPNARYDDQVDATVHALTYMSRGGWAAVARDHRAAKAGPPPDDTQAIQTIAFHKDLQFKVGKRYKSLLRSERGGLDKRMRRANRSGW